MVKSSWMVIDPADESRFHTDEVLVYSPASENPAYPASCGKQTVGLVALRTTGPGIVLRSCGLGRGRRALEDHEARCRGRTGWDWS
mgnify:CR=1 FL=1